MLRDTVGDVGRSARLSALAKSRQRELRDVCLPTARALRINRVLVCPSGVHVVIEEPLSEGPTDALLDRCRTATTGVAATLPARYRDRVRSVLCCSEDAPVADLVEDVLVTSTTTLEHIAHSSPVVLSTSEVLEVTARLGAALEVFPVEPPASPSRWRRWRRLGLAAVVVGAAAGGALAGLDAAQVSALW